MSTLKLFAFGTLTCLALGCSAQRTSTDDQGRSGAQGGGAPSFNELLQEMDANKDGRLARAEVSGPLKQDFAKIDTNSDGFISQAELEQAPRPQRPQGGGGPGQGPRQR